LTTVRRRRMLLTSDRQIALLRPVTIRSGR
jgi:hypothetical protein